MGSFGPQDKVSVQVGHGLSSVAHLNQPCGHLPFFWDTINA